MNIAIILAGGTGNRIDAGIPKQFVMVNDKNLIEYSVETFQQCPLIDEICIVMKEEFIPTMQTIIDQNKLSKVKHIIAGGKERADSSIAALKIYTADNDILLFHDAARPLLTPDIICACIDALQHCNAAGTATPTTDTIWQATDGQIASIPSRTTLWNAQTPQAFRRKTIAAAYKMAVEDPLFQPTDDCSVVHRYLPQEPICIVKGNERNIKITYRKDLTLMRQLLNEE